MKKNANKTVDKNIDKNKDYLKELLGESSDIAYRQFIIPALNNIKAMIVYVDGLASTTDVENSLLNPLMTLSSFPNAKKQFFKPDPIDILMESGILISSLTKENQWTNICDSLLSGDTILFLDGSPYALVNSARGWESRPISEPIVESDVRGPRDGFIESIRSNTSLIRRRIRDYGLRLETMSIGERTKTDIEIAYIENLVDKKVLEELKRRLNRIKTDSILESGYIEEFIEDSPYSIFPQIERSERPDKVSAAILEGRIAILVDNTPFVLLVPSVFWQYIQASGDYYDRHYIGTFMRLIRLLALVISLVGTSLYVVFSSYHQEMYPTTLALRAAAGREGVPFPAIIEALIMEIMFEIMREAGIRMPRPVGQAVSIVGTLVIGDAAVNAGLAAPLLIVVVAAAGISSFAIPAYNVSLGLRLLRFPLILLSGSLGILGFLFGTIAIILHLLSLRSFGTPFLAPVNPYRPSGNKDVTVRVPWWRMGSRPKETQNGSSTKRQSDKDLKPEPPDK